MSGGVRRSSARLRQQVAASAAQESCGPGAIVQKAKNARKLEDVIQQGKEGGIAKIGRQRKATRNNSKPRNASIPIKCEVAGNALHGEGKFPKAEEPEDDKSKLGVQTVLLKSEETEDDKSKLGVQKVLLKAEEPSDDDDGRLGVQAGGRLFTVPDPLVECTFIRRPSARNKSPYVGDVQLACGREAIGHFPSLELGGKCVPGSVVHLKPARNAKGGLVGPDAVSPKYGTPKCEFICQLVQNLEPENAPEGTLIGAHPRLGEMAAASLLRVGSVFEPLSPVPVAAIHKEVSKIAGCEMRADFVVEFEDGTSTVAEVKTVVDTDYAPQTAPVLTKAQSKKRCMFIGPDTPEKPYRRAGIFPWGKKNQTIDGTKTGEKVVSERAIRHVAELTRIAKGERVDAAFPRLSSAVIMIVARGDAEYFRVNHDACPAFARVALEARNSGVKFLASLVTFELTRPQGLCSAVYQGQIPVEWDQIPTSDSH